MANLGDQIPPHATETPNDKVESVNRMGNALGQDCMRY